MYELGVGLCLSMAWFCLIYARDLGEPLAGIDIPLRDLIDSRSLDRHNASMATHTGCLQGPLDPP